MKKKPIILILLFLLFNCSEKTNNIIYTPPKAESIAAINNYYGKKITDYYRNFEKIEDSSLIDWYKNQTKYSTSFLNRIKNRDSFINDIYQISKRKSFNIKKNHLTKNNNSFYLKKNAGETNYKLYYKDAMQTNEKKLFDPAAYKPENNFKYKINYIKPSWDEKFVVISLSHSGKELSELVILETNTKKIFNYTLDNVWPSSYMGVNWLPDNSGFTYLYFPESNPISPKFKKNNQSVLHLLGQDPKKLNYIFGNKSHPELNIKETEHPSTKINSSNDTYIIGYLSGVDNFWDAYYTKIEDLKKGRINWKPLYKKKDKIKTSKNLFVGDEFIFMSGKNADNFQLASVNINTLNFNKPTIIFHEKENEVLKTFKVNKDAIYITTSKFGIEASLYKVSNNKEQKLKLPTNSGRIYSSNKSVNDTDLWVSLSGWTSSNERYKYNPSTNIFSEGYLTDKIEYPEFEDIIIKEINVPSHDGVLVPLSIIYNKKINMNGNNPSFFFGYGSYGDAINPFFSPIFLKYVTEGGVLCIPHVRGGGEKGEEWRKGGFKTTKSNTWKDLIACTEYMIDNKYTSKEKTAIYSSSAGGIMVGRAITERPDLFSAMICEVGVLNPIRMEIQPGGGSSNIREFGTVKDSTECMALLEMDAYHHIKDSTDYPATFLTVGMNDPRVVPWESGKFAARLQNSNTLKKPILLYADFENGHSGGSGKKVYEEWGNIFSFALWQTGHPDYQLVE